VFSGNVTAFGGSSLYTDTPPSVQPPVNDGPQSLIDWGREGVNTGSNNGSGSVNVRSSAGTAYWCTGVGTEDYVESRTIIEKIEKTVVIKNKRDGEENPILEYSKDDGYGGLMTVRESAILSDTITVIDGGFYDFLVILQNGIAQIGENKSVKVLEVVTDSTATINIPYGSVLILPFHFDFGGKEINLKGTIFGAQNFTLLHSAKLNVFPNSTWAS
jgi:hypothetical protein